MGSYTCAQGLTRLELIITRDAQTNDVKATFTFSAHPKNPGRPSGRFTLKGQYDGDLGTIALQPEGWLEQPARYVMVGLNGSLSADAKTLHGTIVADKVVQAACTTFILSHTQPGDPWPMEPEVAAVVLPKPPPPPTNPVIARVDGRELRSSEVDLHGKAMNLGKEAALEDLIDLILVENAARVRKLATPPPPWEAEARSTVEAALADALGINRLAQLDDLLVDHAWVKDTSDAQRQRQQRQGISKLRELLIAGRGLNDAWASLNLDGDNWHIAEDEEYAVAVLPEGAGRLKAGDVSDVMPGDGGLHLFKVRGRRPSPEAIAARREVLFNRLRAAARIERVVEAD